MTPATQMGMVRSHCPLLPSPLLSLPTPVTWLCVPRVSFARQIRRSALTTTVSIRCGHGSPGVGDPSSSSLRRTCKNCKQQYDPAVNHPTACRYHTAHFGGETKRKFESVYTGGTMDTPGSGKVLQYWHCCGSEDPFDDGCTAAPHCSYDD